MTKEQVYRAVLERLAKPHTGAHIYDMNCDACHVMEIAQQALDSAGEPTADLVQIATEIRDKAQSSLGNFGLGNHVAIQRELLGRMCDALNRVSDAAHCECGHSFGQHSKGPVRALYCRHCPCPQWQPEQVNR